jgi:hypothetical protein
MNLSNLSSTDEARTLKRVAGPQGLSRCPALEGEHYLEFLRKLHAERRVERYFEIGTQTGKSLQLALRAAVAVDPAFRLNLESWRKRPSTHLFEMTSDEFFLKHDPRGLLGGPIELAFIDGMHLSEFVLRDFINVERHCASNSMIILHDVLPMNFEVAERNRRPLERRDTQFSRHWTGDVWRTLQILKLERPDLEVRVYDCPPTGIALITNLQPSSEKLRTRLPVLMHSLVSEDVLEDQFWSFIENLDVHRSYAKGMS